MTEHPHATHTPAVTVADCGQGYDAQVRRQLDETRKKLASVERITASQMTRLGELIDVEDRLHEAEAQRDDAYRERAQLLAWIAASHPAVLAPAPDVDEPGWQILYLHADGQQLSWHIAPRDAELFRHVEQVPADDPRAQWDGHTTAEKYHRIRAIVWAMPDAEQPAVNRPCVDTCHTVTVDGDTVRVRGAGTLGPIGELALTELIRTARAKLTDAPSVAH